MPLARRYVLVPVAALAACAAPPDRPRFAGRLSAAAELPPNTTAGTGAIRVAYDPANSVMSYKLSFANLSGPPIAVHFHASAGAGETGGIRLALIGAATSPGPLTGQVGLTPEEVPDLLTGRWYVNIHTPRHPDGEIRGQLVPE